MNRFVSLALCITAVAVGCGAPHRTRTLTTSSSGSTGSGGAGGAGGGAAECTPSDPWAQGFVAEREVYVAPGGTGDGTGMTTPYGTLAEALRMAQPGDHVNVAAGMYDCADTYVDGTMGAAQGTMAEPVWVQAEAGAVVDCGDPTQGSTSALQLHGVQYLVIEGLELRNASGHLIQVDGQSTSVLFKSIYAHRAGLSCLQASQSDDVSVEGSELADSGLAPDTLASNASGQILDYVGVHGAYVARSRIHGAAGNGMGSAANVAAQFRGGSRDIVVAQNDFAAAYTAIDLGGTTAAGLFDPPDADYEGMNVVAYANVVRGPMSVAFAAMGCHACAVYNNTVVTPLGHEALRALPGSLPTGQASHTVGLDVENNLFSLAGSIPQDLFSAGAGELGGLTQASNLFFDGATKIAAIPSDVAVVGTPGVVVDHDPKLAAPPADAHLGAGSPALGAGRALMDSLGDHDGVCRVTWDIGAYAAKSP